VLKNVYPFHVIKNLFGYRKVRYKGLANLVLEARCEGRIDRASTS